LETTAFQLLRVAEVHQNAAAEPGLVIDERAVGHGEFIAEIVHAATIEVGHVSSKYAVANGAVGGHIDPPAAACGAHGYVANKNRGLNEQRARRYDVNAPSVGALLYVKVQSVNDPRGAKAPPPPVAAVLSENVQLMNVLGSSVCVASM